MGEHLLADVGQQAQQSEWRIGPRSTWDVTSRAAAADIACGG
jgi:hypothetical protein